MSSGTQLIDLVHVHDVVTAFLAAAELSGPSFEGDTEVFAASSGNARPVREVVELLGRVAGRPVPVYWGARPDRDDEMLVPWRAGPPVPGWAPAVTLDQGIADLLAQSGPL